MVLFFVLVFPIIPPPGKFSADILSSMFKNFKVITLSGTGRRTSGGMHLGARALKAYQHTLFRHLKSSFLAEI